MPKRMFQSLQYPLTSHQVEVLNSMLENLFKKSGSAAAAEVTGVLGVDKGGTGRASAIPYSVITGGISTTGQHQSVSDVGTAGQVLTSNGAGVMPSWEDTAATLDDLTDVVITGPVDGDLLTYDSGSGNWVNEQPATPVATLDDLTDVTITAPADGEVLTYDSGSGQWINGGAAFVEWSVLTNGNVATPELIFAGGDVIMTHIP